jgi:hypothetical protein
MAGRDDGGYGFVDPRPRMDPADMGPHIGPGRGYRMVECMDAWGLAGRTYAELAERVPRADGRPGHVSKAMLSKMRRNPERVSPAQAKAIADAAAEVSGLDWRYLTSGRILTMEDAAASTWRGEYDRAFSNAIQAADITLRMAMQDPDNQGGLAVAFGALATLAYSEGQEELSETLRDFSDRAAANQFAEGEDRSLERASAELRMKKRASNMDVS